MSKHPHVSIYYFVAFSSDEWSGINLFFYRHVNSTETHVKAIEGLLLPSVFRTDYLSVFIA